MAARRSLSYTHSDSREIAKIYRRSCSVACPPNSVSSGGSHMPVNLDGFSSRLLSLRAQKKLVSGLSNRRAVVKIFLEEPACRILDYVYKLVFLYTGSTKESNRIMRSIVKINMKVGVLYLNNILSEREKEMVWKFRERIHEIAETIILYAGRPIWDVDLHCLIRLFRECESLIVDVVQSHLSSSSLEHLRSSVDFFTNRSFLEALYNGEGSFTDVMNCIVDDVRFLSNKGVL